MENIGHYGIEFAGIKYGKPGEQSGCYVMVEFFKFDDEDTQVDHKILYFQLTRGAIIKDCVPKFRTEEDIENFLKGKKNFQKFFLKHIDKITEM